MIYFGDGETDIPCMKMVKANGGYSIAVYKPKDKGKRKIAEKLILDNRVNFVCQADYRDKQDIYNVVTTILEKIKRDYEFEELQKKHLESARKNNTKNKSICRLGILCKWLALFVIKIALFSKAETPMNKSASSIRFPDCFNCE
jgi:hypothetical protein